MADTGTTDVDTGELRIHATVRGQGPPLLLLHGYPQTHLMWRHLIPRLAETHTVVATDTIAATCADYRAGGTTDLVDDDASAAVGARVGCPTLVLWGRDSIVGRAFRPLDVWCEYATDVSGAELPAGHFLPEEVPGQVFDHLRPFLV